MTTILFTYGLAFLLALALVPLAGKIGRRWGAMDYPGGRKQHARPVPRTGGAGIVAAFCFTLIATRLVNTNISQLLEINWPIFWLFAGACVCAGVGFVDDFHRLGPKVKFIVQVVAATMAYGGGVRIEALNFFGIIIQFAVISG